MIYCYCRKCKQENPGTVCPLCGNPVAPGSQRDIWNFSLLPVSDGRIWSGILKTLLGVAAFAFAVAMGMEYVYGGANGMNALLDSSFPALTVLVLPLGLAVSFFFLLAQGKEDHVYVLDPKAAHVQVWHEKTWIKCLARLQTAVGGQDQQREDGTLMHVSQERHFMWQDLNAVRYCPEKGQILLYYSAHCGPFVLRVPQDEFETAANYVARHFKNGKR